MIAIGYGYVVLVASIRNPKHVLCCKETACPKRLSFT
jgi:hypothetical protein